MNMFMMHDQCNGLTGDKQLNKGRPTYNDQFYDVFTLFPTSQGRSLSLCSNRTKDHDHGLLQAHTCGEGLNVVYDCSCSILFRT